MRTLLLVASSAAVAAAGIVIALPPTAMASCHQGTVGPEDDGTYIYCPDGNGDWVHVDHSVCQDFASWFPQRCGGGGASAISMTIPGDGTYRVGSDVTAGTYRTAGTSGGACSWETHSSMANSGNIIDGNFSTGGQLYADIPATAVMFETHGCLPWARVN